MKKIQSIFIFVLIVFSPFLVPTHAQEADLKVFYACICRDVIDLEPINGGKSFPSTVGELYCFTKIVGAHGPTEVTHVWYYGYRERARVDLAVNSSSWRTFSSKKIQPMEVGPWHVDVLRRDGYPLHSVQFEIVPRRHVDRRRPSHSGCLTQSAAVTYTLFDK